MGLGQKPNRKKFKIDINQFKTIQELFVFKLKPDENEIFKWLTSALIYWNLENKTEGKDARGFQCLLIKERDKIVCYNKGRINQKIFCF